MSLFSSSSSSKQNTQDQRQVGSEQAINIGQQGRYFGSGSVAGGNNSVINVTSTDAAVQKVNAELLGAVAESQLDSIKAIVGLGAGALKDAADLYGKSSSNATQAWGATLEQGRALAQSPDKATNETLQKLGIALAIAVGAAFVFR